MILLANDPNAARLSGRSTAPAGQARTPTQPQGRAGHRWPFLSSQNLRPVAQEHSKNPRSDGGS